MLNKLKGINYKISMASLVVALVLSNTVRTAHAIEPASVLKAVGFVSDYISSKKKAKDINYIKNRLDTILARVIEMEANLISLNCNLLTLDLNQNIASFKTKVDDYYGASVREKYVDNISSIANQATILRNRLQDAAGYSAACGLTNQQDNFPLYMYMMSLDIALNAESIRAKYVNDFIDWAKYYSLLNTDPIAADTYIKSVELTYDSYITNDTQVIFKNRLDNLFTYLSGVDAIGKKSWWRIKSDSLFSGLNLGDYVTISTPPAIDMLYSFASVDPYLPLYNYTKNGTSFYYVTNTWVSSALPHTLLVWDSQSAGVGELDFMFLNQVMPSYSDFYNRHMYEEYISYIKNNYIPFKNIIDGWLTQVNEAYVTKPVYPVLNSDVDLSKYINYRTVDKNANGIPDLNEIKSYTTATGVIASVPNKGSSNDPSTIYIPYNANITCSRGLCQSN